MWSGRVLAKYWAIQVPGTVIVIVALLAAEDSLGWPQWIVWTITALWVAKDALLYPLVWRAYDPGYPTALLRMEGAKGKVVDRIAPCGRVRVSGELWRAELAHGACGIEEGAAVRVKGRRGLTLLVEPEGTGSASTDFGQARSRRLTASAGGPGTGDERVAATQSGSRDSR